MGRNTSISLGSHFTDFVDERVRAGRYGSASEAELDQGKDLDGESVMDRLIG